MKKEFFSKPKTIIEQWPGELTVYSWQDYITAIPSSLFVVTGWKSNNKENACLQSWGSFVGDSEEFICILGSVSKKGHMYQSIKETGCCVLNFPSKDIYELCINTINNNQFGMSDVTRSFVGFTKTALATLLIVGIRHPSLVLVSAILMGLFMIAAQYFHFKADNPFKQRLPSLILLLLCAYIAMSAANPV